MAPKTKKVQSKKHVARLERERRQIRLIQYIAIGVVAAVILILAYGYLDVTYLQARQPVAEVNGEKMAFSEACEKYKIPYQRALGRKAMGWDIGKILEID